MIAENFDIIIIKKKVNKRTTDLRRYKKHILDNCDCWDRNTMACNVWYLIYLYQNRNKSSKQIVKRRNLSCTDHALSVLQNKTTFLQSFMLCRQSYTFWYTESCNDTSYTTFKSSFEKSNVSKIFPLKYLLLIKQN